MTLKGQTRRTVLFTTFLALDISLFLQMFAPVPTGSVIGRHVPFVRGTAPAVPILVQSVWVGNVFDLNVVQQPEGEANYVSTRNGELTQFATVSRQGNIGLLAHNYLSGRDFSRLVVGQEVNVLYSDRHVEQFIITQILRYQALDPKSPYSSFRNLDDPDDILTVGQMFDRVYQGERHITLQTCIANKGVSSWGRLFILAEPRLQKFGTEGGSYALRRQYRYIPVK